MKYPSHIILDISTRKNQQVNHYGDEIHWKLENVNKQNEQILKNLTLLGTSQTDSNMFIDRHANSSQSYFTPLSIFDIHFIRKEKLYTKLKYSRCPQYDIVSGGFAALLAGFIGFLISEKFGIELVDGGDFYNAFMYGVFVTFSLRPLIRIYSRDNTPYSPISPKYLLSFIRDILLLMLKQSMALINYLILRFNFIRNYFPW